MATQTITQVQFPTMGTREVEFQIGIGKTEYGHPQPELIVRMPKGTHYRIVKAVLHKLAAMTEILTQSSQDWIVQIESGNERGGIYLELAQATDEEAEAGLQVLQSVLKSISK